MKQKVQVKKRPSGLEDRVLWAKPITDSDEVTRLKNLRREMSAYNPFYVRALALTQCLDAFGLKNHRATYEQATAMVNRLIDASSNLIELQKSGLKKGSRVKIARQPPLFGTVIGITWNYKVKICFDPGQWRQKVETLPAWIEFVIAISTKV